MKEEILHSLEEVRGNNDPGHTAKIHARNFHNLIKMQVIKTEAEALEVTDWIIKRTNANPHAFAAHFTGMCVADQLKRSRH